MLRWRRKKHLPTDLQMLNVIYDQYVDTFNNYTEGSRAAKMYVPLDIEAIAKLLRVDGDQVFGRLYYHLDKRYGYQQEGGTMVPFFTIAAGTDRHCVHFPLLASVLATLRDDDHRHRSATRIAVVSLILSIVSILLSLTSLG